MKNSLLLGASLLAVLAAPAFAQEATTAPTATAAVDTAVSDDMILVTGSRIRKPNLEASAPVTTITGEEFFETGQLSVGDTLNDLPQLRSTFSQQNSTRFLGTRGMNLLDLRGLGTQRTLVLVNGRRHVGGDILSNATSPDVNTIPTDLIERVDILTGGASSVYGSDAIAGVVNFILKKDFEGIQVRGQSGLSAYKDAGNFYGSILAGKNFAEGRGNVAVNLEYSNSTAFYGSDRPNLRQNDAFIVVDTDPAGTPNGSDGNPDRTFFRDIRSATISLGGQTGIFVGTTGLCGKDTSGASFVCNSVFQPDGTLVPQTGTRIGLAPNGNYVGGNGTNSREGKLLTLSPNLSRFSANLIGHFEVSPAFVPFVEAKYVRTEAYGSQSGPFFSQGTTLGDPGGRERVRLDNPYLSASARTQLTNLLLQSPVNANTGGALTATQLAAQQAAINAGTFRFNLRRNWVDFGIRDEEIKRETFRIVGGVRGDISSDWNYEVSLNYGEHNEKNTIRGNVNVQRYLLALDTTKDSAGNIVCRSKLNPASTISYVTGDSTSDPRLAGDIAACVPLNPFGQGSVSQAAKDYILVDSAATGKMTQFVASGFISGNLGQLFELPGGAVGVSVGAEYRRETAYYDLDDLTQEGYAFYNAIPTFNPPAFEVKELYGEVSIPILKDVPFFKELTVNGSGRMSDYGGQTGTVFTYGTDATWRIIDDFRVRGSYARAVRAPNLVDLYSEQSQNFAPAPNDPCSLRNIGAGSATRASNCAAAGIPATYDFVYTSSIEIVSGGNPDLKEEKSTSWTLGGVLTPSFAPGLSLSVDYYDITVDNVITAPSAQQIMNACYDAPDLNNPFCGLFVRNGNGVGPNEEAPYQILQGSLQQTVLNYAKLTARGIDTELSYSTRFDWGDINLRAIWTHVLERNEYLDPANPDYANRILSELGDPKNQVNVNASVRMGAVTLGYQLRWIDSMYLNTYEDYNGINNLPPQNADYASLRMYPSVTYHDVRAGFDIGEKFNIYFGIDNLTDTKPPYGLTGVGAGSGIYDVRGRFFYTGINAKF
ncbi:TonB-dependent receptor domain-containing protein [Sandaracinobacteroides hominis]|uniref:TonB-dependent receptor domain-containing protein n=1 Tax=Sandaracinobacteroides hominis TaxID=2780086 RepID=UPI0018F435F9|nr:TonB-dependent receptor [Sandaracinobacteroides hominis]